MILKNNTLKVAGSEYLESLGFFVGISGVGYELLRNLDSEIPNALLLSYKRCNYEKIEVCCKESIVNVL